MPLKKIGIPARYVQLIGERQLQELPKGKGIRYKDIACEPIPELDWRTARNQRIQERSIAGGIEVDQSFSLAADRLLEL